MEVRNETGKVTGLEIVKRDRKEDCGKRVIGNGGWKRDG